FSLMCQILKSGETGTKPASFPLSQGDHDGSKIRFTPVTFSMCVPLGRIFLSAVYDFAKMAFPDFAALEDEHKGLCISKCVQMVSMLDGSYRAEHHFPNDLDTHFTSYTTIANGETFETFLDDCSYVANKEEAIEAMKSSLTRTKSMCRELFHRLKPDSVEFTSLLGLGFWNNGVSFVNEELSAAVQRNRAQILKEMHQVYKSRRKIDYASRLGELLSLLDNMEENATLTIQDVQVYRLYNVYNE
ncbi:hypothetical protein PENTCL1PPCAC_7716, partial [Pristionchus entomophagus]